MHSTLITLALVLAASARPMRLGRRAEFDLANGQDAIKLNEGFKALKADSACTAPQDACVNSGFAQCVGGKFVVQQCAGGTICAALPLVNSRGTSITCTTQADLDARIAATGATGVAASAPPENVPAADPPAGNNAGGGAATGGDLQSSLSLSPDVVCKNFADNGQNPPVTGQTASSTSTNNYINFCALTLPGTPLTDGKQITTGSCNTTPIGLIPSVDKMPSCKFTFPKNNGQVAANQGFTATLAVKNFQTGTFTNAQKTYFAAPQTLNGDGLIIGHSHMVIETLTEGLEQTTPLDPKKFFFFKGVDGAAVNGILSVVVPAIPAGAYRICSINSSSNHQPVIVPIAQHGSLDDCSYFTAA